MPERYCITIEGSAARVRSRFVVDNGRELGHLLGRLLAGTPMPADIWSAYGLRVTIEIDTDQGDDGDWR